MSQTKKNSSEQDVLDQLQKLLETLSNHQKQELINNGTRELETQLLKAQAHLLDNINNNHIFINVGGKVFTTTRKTLSAIPDSKLDKLVTGRAPIMFDESGYFFLDRNPEYFSYVLEFLREGSIAFPQDSSTKKRIIHELNYFDCLVNRSTHWRFDSNAKSFDINLDDQGTTAWNNGYGANSVVFGTDEFIFGVYEWSIEILSSQGNYYMAFGVASKKTAGSNFSAFSYQSCSCITAQGSAFLMKPNAIPGLTKGDIINFTFDADSKKLTAECSKKNLKCEGKVSGDDLYPFFYTYSNPDKVRLLFK